MPIHDYRCVSCAHVHDALVKLSEVNDSRECPKCGNDAQRVILSAPKIDWAAMGAQKDASPEFTERFEKVHKQQAQKEEAFSKEHGDYYNRTPGG